MPLADAQWARIEPPFPGRTARQGGRWRDHREVIDAIAWKFQTDRSGSTSPRGTATGEASTTGYGCGPSTAPRSRWSPPWSHRPTPTKASTGSSRSTRP
ncbi:transposase [Streptomyces sp. NPDC047971]|uniref:transposase n=1 Tax=Streptomyces sp. NPDC047971 TaxID=3154499 RepID=UPI00340F14FF